MALTSVRRLVNCARSLRNIAPIVARSSDHGGSRTFSASTPQDPITVTLFPGDGIGPEIAISVKEVSVSKVTAVLITCIMCIILLKVESK